MRQAVTRQRRGPFGLADRLRGRDDDLAGQGRGSTGPTPDSAQGQDRGPYGKSQTMWILLLGALAAIPAFTTDLYLPALPQVVKDFHSTTSTVQLSITLMMLGIAFGQLIIGPIADRRGRRAPVIIGLLAHVCLSAAIIFSPTVGVLIALRIAQGFANATLMNASMAILRDCFEGAKAASMMSRLMLIIGLSPLLAPTIGSALVPLGGWKVCFVVLGILGAIAFVAVLVLLPETNTPDRRVREPLTKAFQDYGRLLKDGVFVALGSVPGWSSGCIMSYVVSISFILQSHYQLSSLQFALFFAVNGVGMVVFSQVNAQVVPKVGPVRMLRKALPIQLAVALVLLLVCFFADNMWVFMAVLLAMFCFQGFVPANASALALTRHGEMAGSASAVIGFMQTGLGSIISTLAALLGTAFVAAGSGNPSSQAMGTMIFLALLISTSVVFFGTDVIRPGGPEVAVIRAVELPGEK